MGAFAQARRLRSSRGDICTKETSRDPHQIQFSDKYCLIASVDNGAVDFFTIQTPR